MALLPLSRFQLLGMIRLGLDQCQYKCYTEIPYRKPYISFPKNTDFCIDVPPLHVPYIFYIISLTGLLLSLFLF